MMRGITVPVNGNVIVGLEGSDDAGVYRLTDEIALIQTVDYITPIVDDPFTFGRIAAVNSLSDVYAMGGTPLTALNIVCFPTSLFSLDRLTEILKGGLTAINEAGATLLGGHSVDDRELKYGLSVTGIVHPGKVLTNTGLCPGDALVLTKPLGTGIIATAVKAGLAASESIAPFEKSMSTLNKNAAEVMRSFPVHACTDVTGFGLAGHLKEMLGNDSLEIRVESSSLPLIPGVLEQAAMGMNPAGLYRNRDFLGALALVEAAVSRELADVVFDPQTSGGLLIALESGAADEMLSALRDAGVADARVIGRVVTSERGLIRFV